MKVMRFAMKMPFQNPVCEGSLENIKLNGDNVGYRFAIRLNYYRGHFLSVIDELAVKVDGQQVPEQDIRFILNGKSFGICELKECYTEFWNIRDAAGLEIFQPGGLQPGEHEVELEMFFRSPYMATGPDHQYMPIDNCGKNTLTLVG